MDILATTTKLREALNFTDLKAWATDLPPRTIVGQRECPTGCPVQRYLEAKGFRNVTVTSIAVRIYSDQAALRWTPMHGYNASLPDITLNTPTDWRLLIHAIDAGYLVDVSRETLLACIEKVEADRKALEARQPRYQSL